MANRQIEEVRNREAYPLAQRTRTRNLPAQVSAVVLQPVYFFRTLTDLQNTRQWLWIGILILLLTGISSVRQQSLASTTSPNLGGDLGGFPPVDVGGGDFGGIGIPPDFGGPPVGTPSDGGTTSGGGNLAATWTTALIAATKTLVMWGALTLLLCEVSLFNGIAPRTGHNFQIAIWSSIPLGMMAALQLVYYGGGGMPGQPGLTGLVTELPNYDQLPQFIRSLLLSFAANLTVFWVWSLILVYYGARFALQGKRWSSLLVVVVWVIVLVFTPVLTGAITAPETQLVDDGGIPFDPGMTGGPEINGELPIQPESTGEAGEFDTGELSEPTLEGGEDSSGESPDETVSTPGATEGEEDVPIESEAPVRVRPIEGPRP